MRANRSDRFERLPAGPAERSVEGRPARSEVVGFLEERFGIPAATFADATFWEKGSGKIWLAGTGVTAPIRIEALGLLALRTRQEYWKPTTNLVQLVGRAATRNVVDLDAEAAARFVAGADQPVDWAGDWGYLIATAVVAGDREPLGVGLFTHGTLRSQIPKGRRVRLEGSTPAEGSGGSGSL